MKEIQAKLKPASSMVKPVSVVVIGRNEGARLERCLQSLAVANASVGQLIYVDSNSSDQSCRLARQFGAQVISMHSAHPSAARARNIGWQAASAEFVLFLDGDTILQEGFVEQALQTMQDHRVAVVWGHRREIAPQQSFYVRVLDLDWIYAAGESSFCGGDALMRRSVLQQVAGFDSKLIAGEEPELCQRIRACGRVIAHIDAAMTLHDLAITSFRAYWQRAFRSGHAYAQIAQRFRHTPEQFWLRDAQRNFLHAGVMLACPWLVLLAYLFVPKALGGTLVAAGLIVCLLMLFVLVLLRSMQRARYKSIDPRTLFCYALHSQFQQIPICFGQLYFHLNHWRARSSSSIDYKGAQS